MGPLGLVFSHLAVACHSTMLGVEMSCVRKLPFPERDKVNENTVFRLSVDHIGLSLSCRVLKSHYVTEARSLEDG